MFKICFIIAIIIRVTIYPIFAQNNIDLAFRSDKYLKQNNNIKNNSKNVIKFKFSNDKYNALSKISLNYFMDNKINFDGSSFEYSKGIATYGIGSIDRNWSFSNNTSLILSSNARPINSIYLNLSNKFNSNWMPKHSKWSINTFNGYTKGSLNNSESMLFGMRGIFSPTTNLSFELVQTVQWGGKEFNNNISDLFPSLLLNTNDGSNSYVNKMAGAGISYKFHNKYFPVRIYSQLIGEDEAGSLPFCLLHLAGLEWQGPLNYLPTTVGFEFIDTRTSESKHGYCGSNTAYNNNTYNYANDQVTIGAPIDTEGKSLEFFGKSQIAKNFSIKYSIKNISINETNWSNHRLSSVHKAGFVNSIDLNWVKNNLNINGSVYRQGIDLDNAGINKGLGISLQMQLKI
ncbi:capsule assembly Wzi family protein [Amylibacter sp.]|nr:capsule assembly Wzi family protein [Amylibacter sp.]MDC1532061.1 capsule assembly Wzi family protein [Amylibacter sp.]